MALFLANVLQTAHRLRQLTLATVAVTFHPSVSVFLDVFHPHSLCSAASVPAAPTPP